MADHRHDNSDASGSPSRSGEHGRRWDDAPADEAAIPSDNSVAAVLRLVKRVRDPSQYSEVFEVRFSASDDFLAASVNTSAYTERSRVLTLWRADNDFYRGIYTYGTIALNRLGTLRTTGGFEFSAGPPTLLAVPDAPQASDVTALAVYNLDTMRHRKSFTKACARPPLAWSPDGARLAGAARLDPSRIVIFDAQTGRPELVVPHHAAALTHLAFTADGSALVSAGLDGFVRLTSTVTGRTLGKLEVESRSPPSLLQASPSGELVASVWGREVMLWSPRTGAVDGYRLPVVRATEGWPLCISPDCRFLVCRTETGFDVSDLATGRPLAEAISDTGSSSFVTAASFTSDGCWLAVGKHSGSVYLYSFGLVAGNGP